MIKEQYELTGAVLSNLAQKSKNNHICTPQALSQTTQPAEEVIFSDRI